MAWTSTDLEAIERAIASGVRSVQFRDRTITYPNMDELLKARDKIKAEVDTTVASSTRCTFASYTKD